jgi:hypothetical protein
MHAGKSIVPSRTKEKEKVIDLRKPINRVARQGSGKGS